MNGPKLPIDRLLAGLVPAIAPAGQLVVRISGEEIAAESAGSLDDDQTAAVTAATLFDLASITKIVTATAFLALIERGRTDLGERVRDHLPAFGGRTHLATAVTWRHLLSHTSGLPATVWLQDAADPEAARATVLAVAPTATPGTRVTYSDVGFMILGFGIEAITGRLLADAISELVLVPAGLHHTRFRPGTGGPVAPTELCPWRGRRLRGEVHDESAAALGGVAGHAGLFANAADVARLGELFLEGGGHVICAETVAKMTTEQATDGVLRCGLGLSLWSPDREAASNPFGPRTYGHTGFTGTSLWVDPERRLVVALLTNAVYRGRDDRGMAAARIAVHRSIVAALDERARARAGGSPMPHVGRHGDVQPATEARHPGTVDIDELSTVDFVRTMNAEDARVPVALAGEVEAIAQAIDAIAERMRRGGRLIYVGAGTSGRLGVLDAAECPATFGSAPGQVVGVIAGGLPALTGAIEDAEDDEADGCRQVADLRVRPLDSVVGITASGSTPFVIGALREARGRGALVVSVAGNRPALAEEWADIRIAPIVGPEIITGSTRLKAGTAQKLVLNMLSTGVMVRLGKTFGNLMVDVSPTNAKLRERARRIVELATGVSADDARALLEATDGNVKVAIVSRLAGLTASDARRRLADTGGSVRAALEAEPDLG